MNLFLFLFFHFSSQLTQEAGARVIKMRTGHESESGSESEDQIPGGWWAVSLSKAWFLAKMMLGKYKQVNAYVRARILQNVFQLQRNTALHLRQLLKLSVGGGGHQGAATQHHL